MSSVETASQIHVNLWQDIHNEAQVTQEVLVGLAYLTGALIKVDADGDLQTGNLLPEELPEFGGLLQEIGYQWQDEEVQMDMQDKGLDMDALKAMYGGIIQRLNPENPNSRPFIEFTERMRSESGIHAKYSLTYDATQSDNTIRAYTLRLHSSKNN